MTNYDRTKWWVLLTVGLGTFMSALDASIVNITLPAMRADFGVDIARIEWVVTVYLLVVSALLLTFGRLGDLRGHRQVYLVGFGIFIVASGLCGLSPNEGFLIGFRALQALGAAMLFATSPAILTASFPASQRGQALGLQATMTYLGLTVGPPLGGWLADTFSWRAIFYVNVPVGLLAFWLGHLFIARRDVVAPNERFDVNGAATFSVGLVALLVALNRGHAAGWLSTEVIAPFAVAVVLLAAFVRIEGRTPHPMLDLSLFRSRMFSASAASALLNYVAVYHVVFVLPFYLLEARGLSASRAGLLLAIQSVVMAVVAPLSGTLSDRIGPRALTTVGMLLMAGGLGLLSLLSPSTPLWFLAASLALVGLGTGTFISPNNSALMGAAPPSRQGIASGVMAEARNVGMVLGVGLAGAVLSSGLARGDSHDPNVLSQAAGASLFVAALVALAGTATAFLGKTRQNTNGG